MLDAQHPAAPSAGLPVALMAPHHGAPDNPISQLSRLGLAATRQAARSLLTEGQDWSPCGALQRAGKLGPQALWCADAAWVKPAALVAAWLTHPLVKVQSGVTVQRLQHTASGWQAFNSEGALLATADTAVLANAHQASRLLQSTADDTHGYSPALQSTANALHQVAGQVVYGPWTAQWQALWPQCLPELAQQRTASNPDFCAVNGNGHFIPNVPWGASAGATLGQAIWLSGSTYEHDTAGNPQVTTLGLAANLQRLQQLIPAATHLLAAQHSAGQLQGWAGTRCTTRDRLPIVGPVSPTQAPGLYACTAMGSRGLSFAAVCGQQVARSIANAHGRSLADSLPVHLQQALGAQRFSV